MRVKKIVGLVMAILLMVCQVPLVYADVPYKSYTYSYWGEAKEAPQAYIASRQITGEDLGCGTFKEPQGIFVKDNKIYIVDTGNNRIVVTDDQWNLLKVIEHVMINGEISDLNQPRDIYVNEKNEIYIADTGNERLLHLDEKLQLIIEIKKPESNLLPQNSKFEPLKITADRAGRIYIVAQNINQGLMELDKFGEFTGFVGANKVSPNLVDYFWKSIATKEQKAQMKLFVPVEFNNIYLDKEGFLYVTTNAIDQNKLLQVVHSKNKDGTVSPIKKLNSMGVDILRRNGYFSPIGEIEFKVSGVGNINGPSEIIDVVIDENRIYSMLDRKRGRIFTYDFEGNLLYIFGSNGNQQGTFKTVAGIEKIGDNFIAIDRGTHTITEFEPTVYGNMINEALKCYSNGEYDKSAMYWKEVLEMNGNFDLAYIGIGRALYREGNFKEALEYFKLGQDRENYSNTYKLYRKQVVEENFNVILFGILIVGGGWYIYHLLIGKHRKKNSRMYSPLRYAFYVIFRPIDGFWDLKHEKRGNLSTAMIILLATIMTFIFAKQETGFLFNTANPKDFNLIIEIFSVVIPFLLWCIGNWCLTTLMDGKGKFKEIVMATSYALLPLVLINLPMILVSNVITSEEGAIYFCFLTLANIWFGALLLLGNMSIHDYSISKTISVAVLTGVSMGVMIFISVLFFDLIEQMVSCVLTIYKEIVFRL